MTTSWRLDHPPSNPRFTIYMMFLLWNFSCFMAEPCYPKHTIVNHQSFECYFRWGVDEGFFFLFPMVSTLLFSHEPHFESWALCLAETAEACSFWDVLLGSVEISWMNCCCVLRRNSGNQITTWKDSLQFLVFSSWLSIWWSHRTLRWLCKLFQKIF